MKFIILSMLSIALYSNSSLANGVGNNVRISKLCQNNLVQIATNKTLRLAGEKGLALDDQRISTMFVPSDLGNNRIKTVTILREANNGQLKVTLSAYFIHAYTLMDGTCEVGETYQTGPLGDERIN